jgi:hypothetical protein
MGESEDVRFDKLLRLISVYWQEAQKCRESKAFLAGCVMIGAALEAMLLAFAMCHQKEALSAENAPRKDGRVKSLRNWSLRDLLAVADELGWLPSGLSPRDEWDEARAEIGDYAELVRRIRNFVHPACYASELSGEQITDRHWEFCFEILCTASDYLLGKLGGSIREELKARSAGGSHTLKDV